MAKPILLVGLHSQLPQEAIKRTGDHLSETMPDYHVLTYPQPHKTPKFEVLNAENLTPVNFEELKTIIKNKLSCHKK